MLDTLVHGILKLGHVDVIILVVVGGMLFHKRNYYETATCFVCFVMIFNQLLKDIFKVPLLAHLGSGYAFPSGHMHAATIFYGYILFRTGNIVVKIALLVLLGLIGFALVHLRFHDWFDVLGAVAFAVTEIGGYAFLRKRVGEKFIGGLALILSLLILLWMHFSGQIQAHVWLAFYILVSSIICRSLWGGIELTEFKHKMISLLLIFTSLYLLNKLGIWLFYGYQAHYLSQLKFLFLPISIFLPIFIVGDRIAMVPKTHC
jgi:undecaprenyl-diphosphatase